MRKLLILGAEGQLGLTLADLLREGRWNGRPLPPDFAQARVRGLDVGDVDITDAGAVFSAVADFAPDAVLNCAAMTDVDACELQPEAAFRVNALGAGNVARACARAGAALVHLSTDYVFDGDAGAPYAEWDAPAPRSAYGKSKLLGETFVREGCPGATIVRTAWLYGRHGKNFVRSILDAAREQGSLRVVDDQRGNPTNAEDLAYHLLKILIAGAPGVYHVTGGGACTRFEFAREIVRLAGLACAVEPCATVDYPRPAPRPVDSALDHLMLRCTVGDEMRAWPDALAAFFRENG